METTETTEDLGRRVRDLIGRMSPLGERTAESHHDVMNDLGYDSVAIVELALVLESEFDLRPIDDEQAFDVVTVGDVEQLVRRLSAAGA
ncbi:phosphopantetheine-binding protein [Actinomadura fulvescens]|uniref:Carrier domain-containing protein n=1 Tax=Actinomadura fulvescens TaxID=46160 RepID=A0ABP6BM65_9ACTN